MNYNKSAFFIFGLVVLSNNVYAVLEKPSVIVSLGRNCEGAVNLRNFGLRTEAYPFDWMSTISFSGVYFVIQNRFSNFLNPEYLQHNGMSVLNTYYNINFRHDFPTTANPDWVDASNASYQGHIVDNFLDYLGGVSQKYERRIARFLKLLDGSTRVVFVRTRITPDEAQNFVNMITVEYPLADYQLVVIHGDPKLNYDWNIPKVLNFYAKKKHSLITHAKLGWFHQDEWKKIFIKIGFIKPGKKKYLKSLDLYDLVYEGDYDLNI